MKNPEAPTNLASRELYLRERTLDRDIERMKEEREQLRRDLELLDVKIRDGEELADQYDTVLHILQTLPKKS